VSIFLNSSFDGDCDEDERAALLVASREVTAHMLALCAFHLSRHVESGESFDLALLCFERFVRGVRHTHVRGDETRELISILIH